MKCSLIRKMCMPPHWADCMDYACKHQRTGSLNSNMHRRRNLGGTGGMCPPPPPPPHTFLLCATPTLYVLYYKLCPPSPQSKSLSYASDMYPSPQIIFTKMLQCCTSLVPRLSPQKRGGRREPGNIRGKSCRLPAPCSGGTNQIAE